MEKKSNRQLFIMTLPALIKIFIFSYLPMFGIVIAFKNLNYADGIFGSPWVGLKNFEFFFKSDVAWRITRNTIVMNFIFIVTGLVVSILFSLLLYKIATGSKGMMRLYQSSMFFPYFLSWVVVGFLLQNVISTDGFINTIITNMGLEKIDFMKTAKYWPWILTFVNIWKCVGYNCIIYFSVLLSIDTSLYEAAKIDGASGFQIMSKIQLPHLTPMIVLNVIMAIGNIFRADFGMFYFLPGTTNTFVLEATDVIDTYVFRAVQGQGNLSMAAAVGIYQSLVGLILVLIANYCAKKYDPSYNIF